MRRVKGDVKLRMIRGRKSSCQGPGEELVPSAGPRLRKSDHLFDWPRKQYKKEQYYHLKTQCIY